MAEIKINPSSAAWAIGRSVLTPKKNGCLRHMVLKRLSPMPDDIPVHLQEMGAEWEDMYFDRLMNDQPHPFHKEFAFSDWFEGVKRSGRVDYIVHHPEYRVIVECKASQSKNVLYQVIRKRIPDPNHLAQLVFYLIYFQETRGKLAVRYAPTGEEHEFRVEIDNDGNIIIDGKKSEYSVMMQLQHQLLAAEAIKDLGHISRPMSKKACDWCPYDLVCEALDNSGQTIGEFLGGNS
jgi:CRISPR/Cas system-associated exonuclease Cas4 (RecB family)